MVISISGIIKLEWFWLLLRIIFFPLEHNKFLLKYSWLKFFTYDIPNVTYKVSRMLFKNLREFFWYLPSIPVWQQIHMLYVGCRSPSSETFSWIHKLQELQFHSKKVILDVQGFFGCPSKNLKKKKNYSFFILFSAVHLRCFQYTSQIHLKWE